MKILLSIIALLIIFCASNNHKDLSGYIEADTKSNPPEIKTMVRFSRSKMKVELMDTTIEIIEIDSVLGVSDTSFYIKYRGKNE